LWTFGPYDEPFLELFHRSFHESSDNEWKLWLIIGIPVSVIILALIAIIFAVRRRREKRQQQEREMQQKGKLHDIPVIEDVAIGEKIGHGNFFSLFPFPFD